MTERSPRSYSPVQRRRRPVHPDDRALEVVLNSTSVLLWVPYTLAAIYVAYCNAYFIESDHSSTSAVEWKARLLHTLTHSPPATAATTLFEHTRLSHRYNQFYYYIFPEGFDVIAFLPSLLYILSVSAIAIASTHFCAVHIEKGGEFLMVVAWVLGVLSERWWLTSSSSTGAVVSSSSGGGGVVSPSATAMSQTFSMPHGEHGGSALAASGSGGHAANVPASTLLQGASLMVLYHAAIPTPPSWLWLVVSMLTGLLSGVLCKVKDIVEGKQDRYTHLFRWFNEHYPPRAAPPSSASPPPSSSPTSSPRRLRGDLVRRALRRPHSSSAHSASDGVPETRNESGEQVSEGEVPKGSTREEGGKGGEGSAAAGVGGSGKDTAHSSRSDSPDMPTHSLVTTATASSARAAREAHVGSATSNAIVSPMACQRPARHHPIGLGERLYMVVPFCTGQWFHFIMRHGWRGIILENGIIVLSLGMVGYTMLSYKLLQRQVRGPTRRRIRTTTVTRSRPSSKTHAKRTAEGTAREKNDTSDASQGDDVELEYTAANATTAIIEDESSVVDLIDLIYRLFTTSFGVVVLVVLALDVFLTSLAIPFIKALFSLDALVSSAGIIVELIVYDMV